jgi:hypothetical protein
MSLVLNPSARRRRAPARSSLPVRPVQLELPSVSFFGRTLAEYSQFFALDVAALRGRAVLDVAAGPSSFTAEACRRGVDAIAIDPLYGCTPDALAQHVTLDYRAMFAQLRAKPQLLRFRAFSSIDEAEVSRRAAAERFLADYAAHFVHNRYIGAALPLLPFFDKTFDLVLCAHLLFVYAARFDFDFHVAACRELVRVSRDDVRIHPLVGPGGRPYPKLRDLRLALAGEGIESEIVKVDYEFFAGTDSTLVLRRKACA